MLGSPAAPGGGGLVLTWSDGAALLAVLIWGSNFPIIKQLMTVVEPLSLTFIRAVCSSLVFAVLLSLSNQWQRPRGTDTRVFVLVGLIGLTLNGVFYAYGLHLTTASHSGLIFTITPLFVFGLSFALGHLRIARLDVLGLGLGWRGRSSSWGFRRSPEPTPGERAYSATC